MTLPSASTGGSLGHRQIRSLYPRITEKHLRYLEKWGLVRAGWGTFRALVPGYEIEQPAAGARRSASTAVATLEDGHEVPV